MLWDLAQAMTLRQDSYRARAYQRAAQSIEASAKPIEELAKAGALQNLAGVGPGIANKIDEFLATGKSRRLESMRKEMPQGIPELLSLPGLGPKRAQLLVARLGIRSVAELAKALKEGRVRSLPRFGADLEKRLLEGITVHKAASRRIPYGEAEATGKRLVAYLRESSGIERIELAGSLRRGRDTVGDLDIVAAAAPARARTLIDTFVTFPGATSVIEKGTTRARIRLRNGAGVDLRVLPPASFGAALIYFTGSKEHNIRLRQLALKRGWSLNEASLHRKKDGKVLAGKSEAEVYEKLGLQVVPPELREGRAELADAAQGTLPTLVQRGDLRGDLHVHTDESDGRHSLKAMCSAAARLGYRYLGISDHGETLRIANGLSGKRFAGQRKAIEALRRDFPDMTILQGAEVDILKDGSLGQDAKTLRDLDYVMGSVHSAFTAPVADQTKRLVAAIQGGIDILGHPAGRRFPRRPGIEADWTRVFEAAKDAGVILEVDGTPDRLDLTGEQAGIAREIGCSFTIDSDAHATVELEQIRYGIIQARRGGLEARHVANTKILKHLVKSFGHAKRQ